jgi:RNA polymerase sigma-70 factor (sigma-E family)
VSLDPGSARGTVTRRRGIEAHQGGVVWLDAGRARDRDRELTDLFLNHYDPLRRLAYVIMGDASLAEEITMEAFAKALSKWRLMSRADHPHAYLRQIVVNLCRSKIRRKMVERKFSGLWEREADEATHADIEDHGLSIDVWNAVRRLPDRQRTCIVLRYLEDLSEPDIAAVLDVPVGTVKSQLSRGRKKLSEWLGTDLLEADA